MRMPPSFARSIPCFVAAGVLVLPAVALGGTWKLPPAELSPFGAPTDSPGVVMQPSGRTTAIWRNATGAADDRVRVSSFTGGAWGTGTPITPAGDNPFEPMLAINPAGTGTAVWRVQGFFTDFVQAARYENGTWSNPVDLSTPGNNAGAPAVVVDDAGVATAVWAEEISSVWTVRAARYSGGAWGSPVSLSAGGQASVPPAVTVDASGTVTAAWRRSGSGNPVSAARYSGGAWSSPVVLSTATGGTSAVRVAAAPGGAVTAMWLRNDGSDYVAQSSRFSDGGWSTAVNLSDPGQEAGAGNIAVDAGGTVTAVWSRQNDGTNWTVQAARNSGGGWSSPVNLAATGVFQGDPVISATPSGSATAVWASRSDGINRRVQAAQFANDAWGAAVTLSADGLTAYKWSVATDAAGAATAVWAMDAPAQNVQAARYVVAPSAPRDVVGVAGDGQVALSWTPPLSDGGEAITSYTATASPGGATCTVTTTTCTISRLSNGTAYTFTVTATNAEGTSAPSAPSARTTPQGPSAAALTATLLPSRRRVVSGQSLRMGIRVANTGRAAAQAATSCVRLPANLVIVRAPGAKRSGGTACFAVGTVAAAAQATRVVTVRAVSMRRRTVTVTGSATATGITRVAAAPVRVTVTPRQARARVTG